MILHNCKLPILFLTDEQLDQQEQGVPPDLRDCDERTMTFYEVSATVPYYVGKRTLTRIYIPGNYFLCPLTPDEVESKINRAGVLFG